LLFSLLILITNLTISLSNIKLLFVVILNIIFN